MKNKITVLTGPIKSGKTTNLFKFISQNKSANGILAPIVDNRRVLYHIASKTIKLLETDKSGSGIIKVGRYNFFESAFEWARQKLSESFKQIPEFLIIDEYGNLELNNKGLEPIISELLLINKFDYEVILVVRDYLVESVIQKLHLNNKEISLKVITSL